MQGQIEARSIAGVINNRQELVGTIINSSEIEAVVNPITMQSVKNYNVLNNKPQINDVELRDNKSLEDLNVTKLTNREIEDLINSIV